MELADSVPSSASLFLQSWQGGRCGSRLSAGPHPCSPLFPVWAPAVSRTWVQCPHGPCQPGQAPPPARVPHPATVTFSLSWSEHVLLKGARVGSDSIGAPGSSTSRLLSAAQGGCRGGSVQEAGGRSPGLCLQVPVGWIPMSHQYTPQPVGPQRWQCPGKCSGTTKSCSVVSRGQMGQKREVTGQSIW